ncbi:MFS transporter [Nocardia sp. NPDC058633]|uniref:MFS transporter n=1 Tax=Nocardia sp. NPDC058633 TaxID=3346568 RepID=UPI00364B69CA
MPTSAANDEYTAGAVRLLRFNRPLSALFTARIVSYAGDSLSLVALMLHVANTTGQALAVALLLLVGDFVPSLLSPIAGAVSDRFDRRRVMIACELVQGALVALIALSLPPLPLLLVLVAARAIAANIFMPASRSVVPALVADKELPVANSVIGFGANAAEAFGPLLAAAMLGFLGVRGVLFVDAASFLLSAAVLLAIGPMPPERTEGVQESLLTQAKTGLEYIGRTPALRIICLGFCAVVACNGVDDVALVLLAKETLHSDDSAVGLLLGAVGIGLLIGYALVGRVGTRLSLTVLLIGGFFVSSAGNLLTGLAWSVAAAFSVQAVRGIGIAAMDIASSTLLQRIVAPGMLGRVFGNLYGAIGIAAAASYVGGGLLLDTTDAPTTLIAAGSSGIAVTVAVALTLPRALRRSRAGTQK